MYIDLVFQTGESLDRRAKSDVGFSLGTFYDNPLVRAERLGLVMGAALTAVTFAGVRMGGFFFVQVSFTMLNPFLQSWLPTF